MNETVLQFGAGRFLRGFIDRFIAELNHSGDSIGRVVVVQSTAGRRAELLNNAPHGYPVAIRGIERGRIVDRDVRVESISRALVADSQWPAVLEFATNPGCQLIVSNATEAGYVLSKQATDGAPETLPGKLAAVLKARLEAKQAGAELPLLTILPCELIAANADRLRELVCEQIKLWNGSPELLDYAQTQCLWLNNLVDCIVSDLPDDDSRRIENPLAIMAEPYALLAIQKPANIESPVLNALTNHASVTLVRHLEPYYLRKVRVLNGIHTAMVAKYHGSELDTVQRVLGDEAGKRWTRDLLYGEILPTLLASVEGAVEFADETLQRFANPFLSHRLSDIRLNHEQKVPVRLSPTADDYQHLFGKRPPLLQAAIDAKL